MKLDPHKFLTVLIIALLISPITFASVQAFEDESFFDKVMSSIFRNYSAEEETGRFIETLPENDENLILKKRTKYSNFYYDLSLTS